jgi:hypothetical protein
VTPFTAQVTAGFKVPVTETVIGKVPFTTTVCEVVGLVMESETTAAAVMVTLSEADLVLSATLVAVMLNVAGLGTEAGAV